MRPAPTSPPVIFTASYTTVLPLLALDNLPEKKGMVWTWYPYPTRPGGIYGEYPDVTGYGIHPYSTIPNENLAFIANFYTRMVYWGEGNKELWVTEFT